MVPVQGWAVAYWQQQQKIEDKKEFPAVIIISY